MGDATSTQQDSSACLTPPRCKDEAGYAASLQESTCSSSLTASSTIQHDYARHEQISTDDIVEESKIQVHFCEMTVEEMNQILDWWSLNPDEMMKDENQQCLALHNSLAGLDSDDPSTCESDAEESDNDRSQAASLLDKASTTEEDLSDFVPLLFPEESDYFDKLDNDENQTITTTSSDTCKKFALKGSSDPQDVHLAAQQQHEEVARLLYQTRDMAEQMLSLAETSATEDDDDEDIAVNTHWSSLTVASTHQLFNDSRSNDDGNSSNDGKPAITQTESDYKGRSRVPLCWRRKKTRWAKRRLMKLETTIVSKVLVPWLPSSLLLYGMHRPRAFRPLLLSAFLLLLVSMAAFIRFRFYMPNSIAAPSISQLDSAKECYASKVQIDVHVHIHTKADTDFPFVQSADERRNMIQGYKDIFNNNSAILLPMLHPPSESVCAHE